MLQMKIIPTTQAFLSYIFSTNVKNVCLIAMNMNRKKFRPITNTKCVLFHVEKCTPHIFYSSSDIKIIILTEAFDARASHVCKWAAPVRIVRLDIRNVFTRRAFELKLGQCDKSTSTGHY